MDVSLSHEIRSRGVALHFLFGPIALVFVAFVIMPLFALGWRAAGSGELASNITSGLVLRALRLSAITSTLALLLAVLLGTPLAYLLARRTFPGKALLDVLIDLPLVLPPTVAGVALLVAFGRRGVFGSHIGGVGVDRALTTTAVVLAQLFVAT